MVSGFVVGTGYAWYRQNVLEALYGWLGGLILSIIVRLLSCALSSYSH